MKLHNDDGEITLEASNHIIEELRKKKIVRACCPSPEFILDSNIIAFNANRIHKEGIVELPRSLPMVMVLCNSCGEVKCYRLNHLIGDLEEWL